MCPVINLYSDCTSRESVTRKLIAPRADVPVSCHKITLTRFDSRSPLRIAGCDLVHPNRIAYFVVLFEFIIFIFIIMVNFFSGQL